MQKLPSKSSYSCLFSFVVEFANNGFNWGGGGGGRKTVAPKIPRVVCLSHPYTFRHSSVFCGEGRQIAARLHVRGETVQFAWTSPGSDVIPRGGDHFTHYQTLYQSLPELRSSERVIQKAVTRTIRMLSV